MNEWSAIAEHQYGVVTRGQLRTVISDKQIHSLLKRGTIERLYPGVFRVAGSFPSARQRAMAVVLHCGTGALLSHLTAAELLRLPTPRVEQLHLSVPPTVRRRGVFVVHRTATLIDRDRAAVDGLPCTSATRTLLDLAARLDGEQLEHAFDSARRMGLVTRAGLERRAREIGGHGRAGAAAVNELLRVLDAKPSESRLEVRVARLLRKHGIAVDAKQHRVGEYRIDFVLSVARKLGLECDGFEWHGNRLAWKRDRRRLAALEAAGWRLVHVTWDDVTLRAIETVSRLRQAIAESTTAATRRNRAVHGRV